MYIQIIACKQDQCQKGQEYGKSSDYGLKEGKSRLGEECAKQDENAIHQSCHDHVQRSAATESGRKILAEWGLGDCLDIIIILTGGWHQCTQFFVYGLSRFIAVSGIQLGTCLNDFNELFFPTISMMKGEKT